MARDKHMGTSSLTFYHAGGILLSYTPRPAERSAGVLFCFFCYRMIVMKTVLLIDGENLKGKMKAVLQSKEDRVRWHYYDFRGLLENVLKGISVDRSVFYFAHVKEHPESREKSKMLIQEQRLFKTHLEKQGFEVVMAGSVRGQVTDGHSGKKVLVFREKGVDVRIAVDMVALACDGKASTIILASSDSDLQPAIKEVRSRKVECIYLGFEVQPNKGISYTTNRTILMRNSEIKEYNKS